MSQCTIEHLRVQGAEADLCRDDVSGVVPHRLFNDTFSSCTGHVQVASTI